MALDHATALPVSIITRLPPTPSRAMLSGPAVVVTVDATRRSTFKPSQSTPAPEQRPREGEWRRALPSCDQGLLDLGFPPKQPELVDEICNDDALAKVMTRRTPPSSAKTEIDTIFTGRLATLCS
jgi:hypothetical protein